MPAPFAPLLGLSLGAAFAWAAREDVQGGAGTRVLGRSLGLVVLFTLLVFLPACGYFLIYEPSWAYLYLVEGGRRFAGLNFVTVALIAGSVPAGFLVAVPHARASRSLGVVKVAGGPAALALLLMLLGLRRLGVHATYAQYHGDFGTEPLAGSVLGWAVLWSLLVTTAAAIYLGHSLRQLPRG